MSVIANVAQPPAAVHEKRGTAILQLRTHQDPGAPAARTHAERPPRKLASLADYAQFPAMLPSEWQSLEISGHPD